MPRLFKRNVAAPMAALFAVTLSSAAASAAAGDPTGVWLDDTGRGAIEITKCGTALCGRVVWVKAGKDSKGCGKEILGAVKAVGKGRWDGGWIYSPEHGRKFDVELTPVGNDRLRVMGYAGVKFLSQTRTWTRAPADLVRCDSQIIAKAAPADNADETAAPPAAATSAPQTTPDAAATTNADASLPPVSSETAAANSPSTTSATVPAAVAAAGAVAKTDPVDTSSGDAKSHQKSNVATKQKDDDAEEPPRRKSRLSELKLDKVLKRTGKGTCKLDLPWVKVDFDCKDL